MEEKGNKMEENNRIVEKIVKLDGQTIFMSELKEKQKMLPGDTRIVEVSQGEFKTLNRFQG